MREKRRFKAEIAGKQYTIVGQRSAQHLSAVVEIVNNQLEQLGELAPELSVADRSILMAINAVSDQLVKEQRILELEDQLETMPKASQVQSSQPETSRPTDLNTQQTKLFNGKSNQQLNRRVPFERE